LPRTLLSCPTCCAEIEVALLPPARVHMRAGKAPLIVLKTPAKLIFGIAALAAATSFGTSTSRAFGDAPWCAVVDRKGEAYWDCQYRTFEACYPNGLADRGFCNVNPWPGPSQVVPYKHKKRHTKY